MMRASCLCGTVRWHYDGAFERLTHCHCQMCRKAHAAAFATYAVGPAGPFGLDSGEDAIVGFESSPGFIRSFCRHCGSVLPNRDLGAIVALPAGCCDDDPGIRPTAHIFARWGAPWYPITDALPQHDNYPGQDAPAVAHASRPGAADGALAGSCLCGDIAYAVQPPFTAVYHCHCSRCRKARAAAHTTNGFVPFDALTFTRGETGLQSFKVPDARHFRHVFCARCGSGMPSCDPARGIAVVPFGSLDDDPGRSADSHIFVRSMAPWYEITDALPRFDAGPSF